MDSKTTEAKEKIKRLINELVETFESVPGAEYIIDIQSVDGDERYLIGAEESNNWHRSWC